MLKLAQVGTHATSFRIVTLSDVTPAAYDRAMSPEDPDIPPDPDAPPAEPDAT